LSNLNLNLQTSLNRRWLSGLLPILHPELVQRLVVPRPVVPGALVPRRRRGPCLVPIDPVALEHRRSVLALLEHQGSVLALVEYRLREPLPCFDLTILLGEALQLRRQLLPEHWQVAA
jgi:hypothetical protein